MSTGIVIITIPLKLQVHTLTLLLSLTLLHTSSCCPIPGDCDLPNITQYTLQSQDQELLELTVNISTTQNYVFMPQAFQPTLRAANMNIGRATPNGCEGFFNYSSSDAGVDTPCPWRYQCDYNPQRIPALIFSARCDSATPQGSAGEGDAVCDEVHYPITYIMTTSCNPLDESMNNEWSLETTIVPVTCSLQDKTTML